MHLMSVRRLLAPAIVLAALVTSTASAQAATPRIVGGGPATIQDVPFQVALWDPSSASSPYDGFFCGGVILDATHVLTAAHCVYDDGARRAYAPPTIRALAGSTSLVTPDAGSQDIAASAVAFSPQYDPSTQDHDLAVVTLSAPLWTSPSPPAADGSTAIAPVPGLQTAPLGAGTPLTVSGWGDFTPKAPGDPPTALSPTLKSAGVNLVDQGQCVSDYQVAGDPVTATMLCAASLGNDACYGDSGGPLVYATGSAVPADDRLFGLVDAGEGCADPRFPGVYTAIPNPDIAAFATPPYPPPAPLPAGSPSIAGTPAPGQALTCDPGPWSGATSFTYQWYSATTRIPIDARSPSPSLVVPDSAATTSIACEVVGFDPGGYAYADSAAVGVGALPVGPPKTAVVDRRRPTSRVFSHRCSRTRCVVNVIVTDPRPSAGIRTLRAALTHRARRACRRHGRRAMCASTARRTLRARRMPGGHFLVIARGLSSKRPYTLTLVAVDRAGHVQRKPTRIRLHVGRRSVVS